LGAQGLRIQGTATYGVFRNQATGLRTAVLVNSRGKPVPVQVAGFSDPGAKRLILWQPATGAREIVPPADILIAGDQVALLTEEPALDRLTKVPQWQPAAGAKQESVVFDLRSPADSEGWTFTGDAFSVSSLPGVFRAPTLNSIGKAGESAPGTALSPPFAVESDYDVLEILFHGGTSQQRDGQQNLALRLLDAQTGVVLYETVPPSTHLLTKLSIPVAKLKAGTAQLGLVDKHTGASFAWIGVRRVAFVRRTAHE
jgi:hypothetical protein